MERSSSASSVFRWGWLAAAGCFVLAGLTGAWYRFGMTYGLTAGFELVNIRHAHSHLMYFGWVTPALFSLIAAGVLERTGRRAGKGIGWIIGGTVVAALLAYPPFLFFGYRVAELGAVRMPLSVIAAGLNMLVWYAFVAWYAGASRRLPREGGLLLVDGALAFLVLASLGAWGLSLLQPLGLTEPVWSAALTHFFLDLFSEGWLVLGVLGLAYLGIEQEAELRPAPWSLWLIGLGLPVTFILGMPERLVPSAMRVVAATGTLLAATGLAHVVWRLSRALWQTGASWRRRFWALPLLFIGLKLLAQLAVGLTSGLWTGLHGLRIFYLHLMLLGFVTLGLVAAALAGWPRLEARRYYGVYGAVVLLLASLVPLTELWPAAWAGRGALLIATYIAPLPALTLLAALLWPRRKSIQPARG